MFDLDYDDLFKLSIEQPEKFWDNAAKEIVWTKPYSSVIEDKCSPCPKWFVGGELNISYNCLDRQVEDGHGEDVAVIYDCAINGTVEKLTYNDLLTKVELLAGVLSKKCGVVKGDKVMLFFPRIPQCLMAMLACSRIGAVIVAVYSGSPAPELITIIQRLEPKVVMTTNVGLEPNRVLNYKERIDIAIAKCGFQPQHCVVYNRPNYPDALLQEGRDLNWTLELMTAIPQGPISLESAHPHYIIFTSGTTGNPKGCVRPTAGSVVSNMYTMKYLLNLKPGEVWWMNSDFSWTLGQTVLSYGPLMSRNPTIIFEGSFLMDNYWHHFTRIIKQHEVVSTFSVPTTMRHLRKFAPNADLTLESSKFTTLYIGGELSDSSLKKWISDTFHCNTYDIWGQTELGDLGIMPGKRFKGTDRYCLDGFTGLLLPSINGMVVDRETGNEVPEGECGRFIIKMPIGPSLMSTIYGDHNRFLQTYFTKFPGYYDTMDAAIRMKNGLIKIVSRDDDIIEVGSAGISSGAVEDICLRQGSVVSAAVVPLSDEIKGFVPFAFVMTKDDGYTKDEEVIEKCIDAVTTFLGEYSCFSNAVVVHTMPRTRAGKIPRSTLSKMVNGKQYEIPQTVENPESFSAIYETLIKAGYNASKPILE